MHSTMHLTDNAVKTALWIVDVLGAPDTQRQIS
jgi:hypothetical protein